MQRTPTISTLNLAFALSAFEALGLDADTILARVGLSRERVADPHGRVPLDVTFRWWDAAVEVSGDPALGLRVGSKLSVGAFGTFEYLIRNSESFSQALERANEFMRLIDDSSVLELQRDGNVAVLRYACKSGQGHAPAVVHAFFAMMVAFVRAEWPAIRFSMVRFAHAAPTDPAVFARHFGCPVRFDEPYNEITFPAAALARGPKGADGALARVLEEHARHLLSQIPDEDPLLQSARSELLKLIDAGKPSHGALAKALRMSERTLRRRLEAAGTSYNAVLDGLRSDLARRYVMDTREGFESIAQRLAFGDASTFFRAFKRWTGMTPAQFRERGPGDGQP
jgi:AraC-like DNA-binding protein